MILPWPFRPAYTYMQELHANFGFTFVVMMASGDSFRSTGSLFRVMNPWLLQYPMAFQLPHTQAPIESLANPTEPSPVDLLVLVETIQHRFIFPCFSSASENPMHLF
jgi:hypothetical protein